jgi:cytoskeleton protein RodZ
MAFGANLKRERELRGISLEEISKASKISVRLLDAIEMDRYDILPEGIFRKSFIKSYVRYLGMNEDKVLQEYFVATQAESPPSIEDRMGGGKSSLSPPHNLRWIIAALLAVLVVGAILWYLTGSSEKEPVESVPKSTSSARPTQGPSSPMAFPPAPNLSPQNSPSPPVSPSRSQLKVLGELAKNPEVAPAGSQPQTPITPASAPPGSVSSELTLGIYVDKQSWLSASSGDSHLYSGLLEPQEVKRFSLQKPLRLTFGNAGAVRLSVNGKALASIGKPGEVRVLEINSENYRRYLAVAH